MKFLLVFFCATVIFDATRSEIFLPRHGLPPAGPPKSRAAKALWGTIIQKLDNFDTTNPKTWRMRYISNDQFFKPGGPIFIMLGAEWTIDEGWVQSGQMYDAAQLHGGMMYYTEHRYYGSSYPTSDLSTENLKYLTTDQALADVAHFITQMKILNPAIRNSKVVVFGGSYGGNMAIWLRMKYPQLVHAAVSSSAPVKAQVDFREYYEVVRRSLGNTCSAVITNAVDKVLNLLQTTEGVLKVQRDFKLCNPLDVTSKSDVEYFFIILISQFGGLVQYANGNILKNTCDSIMRPTADDDYTRVARFLASNTPGCLSNYDDLVQSISNGGLNRGDSRQWVYQTCTEYGYFQTSPTANHIARNTVTVNAYYRWCSDFFGGKFTPTSIHNGVDQTNMKYGGLKPAVTRVVSVHGTVDPWHALGLSKDVNELAPVIVVNGTSHCADLYSLSTADSEGLKNAKIAVLNYITKWLGE